MYGFVYWCDKQKRCRTKYICIPFSKLVAAKILKAMASGKSPTKSAKDLHGYSNYTGDSNEWA